jgi:hypothetical protein
MPNRRQGSYGIFGALQDSPLEAGGRRRKSIELVTKLVADCAQIGSVSFKRSQKLKVARFQVTRLRLFFFLLPSIEFIFQN